MVETSVSMASIAGKKSGEWPATETTLGHNVIVAESLAVGADLCDLITKA